MRRWKMPKREPSLDELLGDEIMVPVTRSAGLDRTELRRLLEDLARRVPLNALKRRRDCSTAQAPRQSAA